MSSRHYLFHYRLTVYFINHLRKANLKLVALDQEYSRVFVSFSIIILR